MDEEAARQARQRVRLQQLGVTCYRPRHAAVAAPVRRLVPAEAAQAPEVAEPPPEPVLERVPQPQGGPASAPEQGQSPGAEQPPAPAPAPVESDLDGLDWDALEARVADCRLCGLCEGRTRTVFGVGDRQADLVLVGEGPGVEEDRRGEPFVGQAGQLLDRMLAAIGLDRHHGVYICNVVKCRPPRNRDPKADEAGACQPYLQRQLSLLQPRLVVALGRVPAHYLLGVTTPLGRLRGQLHRYAPVDVPLLATYHPAYLLRNPADKARAWADLKYIRRILAE